MTRNDSQEAAKAALRTKTTETNASQNTAYSSASTKLDAIIGVLGKNTEIGKQAARLRSNLLRQGRSNGGASSSSSSAPVASSSSSAIAA